MLIHTTNFSQSSILTDDTSDISCVRVYINLHTDMIMDWYFKPEHVAKSIQIKLYHKKKSVVDTDYLFEIFLMWFPINETQRKSIN